MKARNVAISVVLVMVALLALLVVRSSPRMEGFAPMPAAADLIYVYGDGPDDRNFTPIWSQFCDDYRDTLDGVGVHVHKFRSSDPVVSQYALRVYPSILLTDPQQGKLQEAFVGMRTVSRLADFVHASFPLFNTSTFKKSG
ncbi:MAG: hypothetical protein WDW38_006403 [Sanguina aurantia]